MLIYVNFSKNNKKDIGVGGEWKTPHSRGFFPFKMARAKGFEPSISAVTGRRFNPLSYTRIFW